MKVVLALLALAACGPKVYPLGEKVDLVPGTSCTADDIAALTAAAAMWNAHGADFQIGGGGDALPIKCLGADDSLKMQSQCEPGVACVGDYLPSGLVEINGPAIVAAAGSATAPVIEAASLAHELGHSMGLVHEVDFDALMHATPSFKATLGPNSTDLEQLCSIYGCAAPSGGLWPDAAP